MSGKLTMQNPFPGLRPFTQEEDYLFFGREEQTIALLQRLAGNRFVAVVGTSGSGKSSLVRCGLLSELLGGKMLQAGASWEIAVTHPGGNPMALLTEALIEADLYDIEEDHVRENLLATLSRSHFGLVEAVKQSDLAAGTNFLLVVDQFEEIFRFHEAGQLQQEIANEFVSLLLEAVAQSDIPIYVVLTMRSDFIGECGQFEGLAEMVNRGEFLIPRLTREQYKRVIEGPVKVAGGKIAPRLLQRLLNDLGQQADQLPCLQHALMRTWDLWAQRDESDALDLDDYQRVGKMAEAMSLHADEIYASLADDRQRDLCRGVFQALTVQESENRGIRRPQRLAALSEILEVDTDDLRPIVDAYRQHGVTFLMPPEDVELDSSKIIDISHESLMRVWARLRGWVEEEAQAAGIYRRLSESATLHREGKAGLYRDPELGIALAWKESSHPNRAWADRYSPGFDSTMSYLDESRAAEEAEERRIEEARKHELEQAQQLAEIESQRATEQARAAVRLRWLVRGVGVVAVIALAASLFALVARRDAQKHADAADQQAAEANRQREFALNAQRETESALIQAEQAEADALHAEQRSREFRYATDLQLASVLLHNQDGDVTQALGRLSDHDPSENEELDEAKDLRGFEWHYLKRLIDARAKVFSGYEKPIIQVTEAPDGQIVGLDEDGLVHRWDIDSGKPVGNPVNVKSDRDITQMALSPDGALVALGLSNGNRVELVDATNGEPNGVNIPYNAEYALAFSSDGKMLITVGSSVAWWEVESGKPIAQQIDSTMNYASPVSLSTDGRTMAISRQGTSMGYFYVLRMNPDTAEVETLIDKKATGGSLGPIAISADGRYVVSTQMFQGKFSVFDTETGLQVSENELAHSGPITSLVFNPKGTQLATASQDGAIKIWPSGSEVESPEMSLSGHAESVTGLAFVSDGSRIVSTSSDLTTRVWDQSNESEGLRQSVPHSTGFQVTYSPDGLLMAIADFRDGPIHLYDAETFRPVRTFERDEPGNLTSVAFSPDGNLLAAGFGLSSAESSNVELWDVDRGERVATMPGVGNSPAYASDIRYCPVNSLVFSPDGKQLAAGFGYRFLYSFLLADSVAKIWDVESRREIRQLEGHDNLVISVAYSPDGKRFATASYDGSIRLWNTANWQLVQILDNPDEHTDVGRRRVLSVAFSPDSQIVAMASHEGNVHIWNAQSGRLLRSLKGHANGVDSVAFSPDGRTLASCASDQTVRLWNVSTWRELTRLEIDARNATAALLTFAPDGTRLVSSCIGVRYWSIDSAPDTSRVIAGALANWLDSGADFAGRIRMLSDNPRLVEGLERLAEERPTDESIQAALIATRANLAASSMRFSEATDLLDQLDELTNEHSDRWLGTPALLRLSGALLNQDRIEDASKILTGGAKRRREDGIVDSDQLGFAYNATEEGVQVTNVVDGYPAESAGFQLGDVIKTINGEDVTGEKSQSKYRSLADVELGEILRMGIRRKGEDELVELELVKQVTLNDPITANLIRSLESAVGERLDESSNAAGLLELRAELAGMWPDRRRQIAHYTEAIDVLANSPSSESKASLARLHLRRGNALVSKHQWSEALADYSEANVNHSVDHETFDHETLSSYYLARAESTLSGVGNWTTLKTVDAKSKGGAELTVLDDDSILASGENPDTDTYLLEFETKLTQISALRLEALTHDSLPGDGPGRGLSGVIGNFAISDFAIEHKPLDGSRAFVSISPADVFADHQLERAKLTVDSWNIAPKGGEDHFAVYKLETPISHPAGIRLRVSIKFNEGANWRDENLGRFRMSANDATDAFESAKLRHEIVKIIEVDLDDDPVAKLAFAHYANGNDRGLAEIANRTPESAGKIAAVYVGAKQYGRTLELLDQSIDEKATDPDLISTRALAHEGEKDWTSASVDWTRAAELKKDKEDEAAQMHSDFAGRLASAGQGGLAAKHYTIARTILEELLNAHPENQSLIGALAVVLANKAAPQEAKLRPVEDVSRPGQSILVEEDISISVRSDDDSESSSSSQPDSIVFVAPENAVAAVKMETFSDKEDRDEDEFDEYQLVAISDAPPAKSASPTWRGRYLRITLPGERKTLNLAEVQVFSDGKNVALGRFARQLGSFPSIPGPAKLAVDGNTNGFYNTGKSVTHSADGTKSPWWEVDLGREYEIDQIKIWDRTDSAFKNRLINFVVSLADASRMKVMDRLIATSPDPSIEIRPSFCAYQTADGIVVRLFDERSFDQLESFRISALDRLDSVEFSMQRDFAKGEGDPRTRLAAGFAAANEIDQSATWFTRAIEYAKGSTARRKVVEQLGSMDDLLASALKLRPQDFDLRVASARGHITKGMADLETDQIAEALEELISARQNIDRLFEQAPDVNWAILDPTEMISKEGAELNALPDGSILAGGKNPDSDVYSVTVSGGPNRIRAFRVEALPHESLPRQGPGRYESNGNFRMFEFRVYSGTEPVVLNSAEATYDERDQSEKLIDGLNAGLGWCIDGRQGRRSWVVLTSDLQRSPNDQLRIEIDQTSEVYKKYNLGSFRLSATDDVGAAAHARLYSAFKLDELVNLDIALGKAFAANGNNERAAASFARALEQTETSAQRDSILSDLTEFGDALARLAPLRPDDTKLQLSIADSHAKKGRSRLQDQPREALSDLKQAAETYHRILGKGTVDWDVLSPSQVTSAADVRLTVLPDDSVLSGAGVAAGDTYSVTVDQLPPSIVALRLETIPHPSLPAGASGWASNGGNFGIEEFRVFLIDKNGNRSSVPIASATSSSTNRNVPSRMLDDNLNTHWAVWPDHGKRNNVIFILQSTLDDVAERKLVIEIASGHQARWQVGRFRLSALGDAKAVEVAQMLQARSKSGGGVSSKEIDIDICKANLATGDLRSAAVAFIRAFGQIDDLQSQTELFGELEHHDGLFDQVDAIGKSNPRLAVALYHYYSAKDDHDSANRVFRRARELYESKIELDPKSTQAAADLAKLLSIPEQLNWSVTKPIEFVSEGGAGLEMLDDGSILASGANPPTDTYRVVLESELQTINAIRLDVLTHPSLPNAGPGRGNNGGFKLSALVIEQRPIRGGGASEKVLPTDIAVDHFHQREELSTSEWNIHPEVGKDHFAVFDLDEPIVNESGTRLTLTMTFHPVKNWSDQNLGRFRVSVSEDSEAFDLTREGLNRETEIASPFARLAVAYWKIDEKEGAVSTLLAALAAETNDRSRAGIVRSLARYDDLLQGAFERMEGSPKVDTAMTLHRAQALVDDKEFSQADEELTAGLSKSPDNIDLLRLRATTRAGQRKWDQAADDYRRIAGLTRNAGQRAAFRNTGKMLARSERWAEAAEIFSEQMLLSDDWSATRNTFVCQLMAGNSEAAEVAARWMVKRIGDSANAFWSAEVVRAAITLPGVVDKDNRNVLLKRAESADENQRELLKAAIFYRLGQIGNAGALGDEFEGNPQLKAIASMWLRDQGQTAAAARNQRVVEKWMVDSVEKKGDDEIADTWLASQAMVQAVYREAADYSLKDPRFAQLNKILAGDPDNVIALVKRSRLLAGEGLQRRADVDRAKAKEGVERLRDQVSKETVDPELFAALGEIEFGDQQLDVSLERFQEAVDQGADQAWILFRLAEIHALRGDWDAAEAWWTRGFEKQPDADAQRTRRLELAASGEHWKVVAEDYSEQLDDFERARGGYSPRSKFLQRIVNRRDPVFVELMKIRPKDTHLRIVRARDLAVLKRWSESAEEYAKGVVETTALEEFYEYAAALLLAGKKDEYAAVATQLCDLAESSGDPNFVFAAARTACLSPHPIVPWNQTRQRARRANRADKNAWFMHAAGLAALRQNDLEDASKWFDKSSEFDWHPELNNLGRYLISVQRDDQENADEYRRRVQDWIDDTENRRESGEMREQCTDWLELNVLLKEIDERSKLSNQGLE